MPSSFLEFGFLVRSVGCLVSGLLSGLRNVGRALRQVLPVFLLLVDDFLIVGDVAWVGHDLL